MARTDALNFDSFFDTLTSLDRAAKDRRIRSPVSMVQMSGRRRKMLMTSSGAKCDLRALR